MHIAGEAGTPQGCVDAVLACRPDVVVLDVHTRSSARAARLLQLL
jgi:hypothetical protein